MNTNQITNAINEHIIKNSGWEPSRNYLSISHISGCPRRARQMLSICVGMERTARTDVRGIGGGMICPHCGKDTDKPLLVKTFDGDLYIDGVEYSVLGIETLTEPKVYRLPPKYRAISTKPPLIVYVEAE